jgi:hypothetical protein
MLEHVIVPLPAATGEISAMSRVRSTVLLSSRQALLEHGHFERYLSRLRAHGDVLRSTYAGVWLPAEVAMAHYEACDELHLDTETIISIGLHVSSSTRNIFAAAAVKLAVELGTTPWTLLGMSDRVWARAWVGSAIAVSKTGPKDAHIRIVGMPCARIPYFRVAVRGFIAAFIEVVATRAHVRAVAAESTDKILGYRVAWA